MFLFFLKALLIASCWGAGADESFKFHLNSEPKSLDPAEVSFGDGVGYFYQNIYHGLYIYKKNGLVAVGAKSCRFQKLLLTCELNPNFKWSDGKVVQASEYVQAFRHLLGFKSKSTALRILKNLKNASEIFSGALSENSLGVAALNSHQLQFKFQSEDPEFLYKLASPLVAPIRSDSFPKLENAKDLFVTGPYKIENWQRHKRVFLTENPYYYLGSTHKPKLEIIFVDDDQTALNLYETKQINFLKTLPADLTAQFKDRADFIQVPMVRFDYIGFSPELQKYPELRKALSLSLNFIELKKMFSSVGMPGCSGLPEDYSGKPVCVSYNLDEAKKNFARLPANIRERHFKIAFSAYHSDDVSRGMQWVAEQWKNHLGMHIEIEKLESGIFSERLKSAIPDFFRKSAIIDRPTCLSAIENFAENGSESFLKLEVPEIDKIITKIKSLKPSALREKQSLCREALTELVGSNRLIGLGKIHFTMLVSTKFTGWEISDLNGLDLSQLHFQAN